MRRETLSIPNLLTAIFLALAPDALGAAEQPTQPQPPTVKIFPPANSSGFTAQKDIQIQVEALDPDGWIPLVEFMVNDKKIGEARLEVNRPPPSGETRTFWFHFWPEIAGQYTLMAKVTDNSGNTALSSQVRISVDDRLPEPPPVNGPPEVKITQPSEGAVLQAPADIEISVAAGDQDGWVKIIEFLANESKIGQIQTGSDPPPPGRIETFTFRWAKAVAGPHRLSARATDNSGNTALSSQVSILVSGIPVQPEPEVIVAAIDAVGLEGPSTTEETRTATFRFTRSGGTADRALEVVYKLSSSAKNGEDYKELPGKLTIPVGASFVDVVVDPIDDSVFEGSEEIVVKIEPSACLEIVPLPPDCYRIGREDHAVAQIRDNDAAANRLPEVRLAEPRDQAVFRARADLKITAEASDADGWVRLVEFLANDTKIGEAKMRSSQPPPPGEKRGFTFEWSDVPPGKYTLVARATDDKGNAALSKAVEIQVGEPNTLPVVTIQARDGHAAEARGNSGKGHGHSNKGHGNSGDAHGNSGKPNIATFRVGREGSLNSDLKVYYSINGSASNGVDYTALPGNVTISRGQKWAYVTLTPLDDKVAEPTETVVLKLELPPGASQSKDAAAYVIGRQAQAAASIDDNDSRRNSCVRLHDGHFVVCLPGMKDQHVRIEVSEDLVHWEVVESNTVTEDNLHFVDSGSPGRGHRYYRVVRVPKPSDDD